MPKKKIRKAFIGANTYDWLSTPRLPNKSLDTNYLSLSDLMAYGIVAPLLGVRLPETSLLPPVEPLRTIDFSNYFTSYLDIGLEPIQNEILEPVLNVSLDYTGVENVSYDLATLLGMPKNPSREEVIQNPLLVVSPSEIKEVNVDEINSLYNVDYGQAALQVGLALGNAAGAAIGGKAGEALIKASNSAGTVVNAAKNLLTINKLLKAKVDGLGTAKAGNAMAIAGAVLDVAGSFMPEKSEYSGAEGSTTLTMDTIYDGISDAAMAFGPVGMLVGGAMKGASFLGKGFNAMGAGTDGMTTTDAVLGSSFFNWNVGLINGIGGSTTSTLRKDQDTFALIGSSYGGSGALIDLALTKAGKKYGNFSLGARNKAEAEILEAKRQQLIMQGIAGEAADRFAIRNSMSAINGNRRALAMLGGYNQSAIRSGKEGMIIAKKVASRYKALEKRKKSDPFLYYLSTLPKNQRDFTNFRVRDYWEFNGRPKDFDEAVSKGMFTQQSDGWHANSVAENPTTGEIEFMKSSSHPSHLMEVDWYNSDDASEFRSLYELIKTEPYWKYIKRKLREEFKEGGKIDNVSVLVEMDIDSLPEEFKDGGVLGSTIIKEIEIEEMIEEFKEGGAFNVIPEGALHARLHHMENAENLTKKGIPVVSEKEGGELELHAEIEKEEIILRLSLTKRLEELAKEDTDEAALEAGKILVEEILNNTIDNVGILNI